MTARPPGDAPSSHDRGRGSDANPARNPKLDARLAELAAPLAAAEDRLLEALAREGRATCRLPVVLVVGAPRSGTTVLVQWLQATGAFATPTNAMARFAVAPGIAARIAQVLFDESFGYGAPLAPDRDGDALRSDLGKTRGARAPHEFFFFWRRHLGHAELAPLGERAAAVDWHRLRAELAAMEAAFDAPLAMKGLMLQYDLPLIAERLPEALFLHVRRDPLENAASLLEARRRFHGDESQWYGTRPPGFEALLPRSVEEQVAGQVALDRRAIEAGLAAMDRARWVTVDLERLREDTAPLWRELRERFERRGLGLLAQHRAPSRLQSGAQPPWGPERRAALEQALLRYEREIGGILPSAPSAYDHE